MARPSVAVAVPVPVATDSTGTTRVTGQSHIEPLTLPAWERTDIAGFGPGLVLDVGGSPLWWASPDVELRASPEAAICLLAPWCALHGRVLELPAPGLDPVFLENVRAATTLMGSWWGHDPLQLVVPPASGPPVSPPVVAPGDTALLFSGGIDSFYSLVRNPHVGALVFIIGFDIRVENTEVWQAVVRAHRDLAAELGLRFITLATNLRDHPVLSQMRWARYHGVLLAATCHLLREQASRWIVSSSFQQDNLMPWGSRPDLDHLWSGGGVHITHYGADKWREEKLVAMGGMAMVHRRLRVCYADPQADGNCGRCERCVRTRLVYWLDLPGDRCSGMPDDPPLVEAIDGVARVELRLILSVYRGFLERAPPDHPATAAIRALIGRSEGQGGAIPPVRIDARVDQAQCGEAGEATGR
ncbi:MAG: hypothetical protein J0M16_10710 [Gammaproteobacteria bacterium]|nr:hypothetical protein [Gammaproteobacteria bacterium]